MRRLIDKDGSAWAGPCLCTPAQAIAVSCHRHPRAAARWIAVGMAVLALAAALPACTNAGAAQDLLPRYAMGCALASMGADLQPGVDLRKQLSALLDGYEAMHQSLVH